MRILAFIYLAVGLLFFFRPEETFYLLNIGPKVFHTYEEIPNPSEHFWVVLTTSMMAMLVVVSLYSSVYPKIFGFTLAHLVSKGISTAGFLFLFLNQKPYFAYLAGVATDGLIFVLVLGFYIRSAASKPIATAESNVNSPTS